MTTGEKIRDMRKSRGMTLQELANKLGCSQSAISQYERGVRQASAPTLAKIAKALQCTLWDITNHDDLQQMQRESSLVSEAVPSIIKRDGRVVSLRPLLEGLQRLSAVTPRKPIPENNTLHLVSEIIDNAPENQHSPKDNTADLLRFLDSYSKLNDEGRRRAFEYMEDLTQLPRYQRTEAES